MLADLSLSSLTDRDLAEAVVAGGAEWAFRELYGRHAPRVFQLIRRLIGRERADAEDILQDVWIQAVRALPQFRWEATFSTWLTGIAINQTRTWWRRRGARVFEPVDERALFARELPAGQRLDLESALASLPDGRRAVLVLHDIEGLTHEEIAERLGVAVGTSKSQLFAARRAMRAYLEPDTAHEISSSGERQCDPIPKTT
jgi:RNA polymerase sigma-70 factor (ECF subfamily)